MTRKECELAMLEHLKAVSELYAEYNPDGDLVNITLWNNHKGLGSNDYGDWRTREIDVWSDTRKEDERSVHFTASIDIDDEDFRNAMEKHFENNPDETWDDYPIQWNYYKGRYWDEPDYD